MKKLVYIISIVFLFILGCRKERYEDQFVINYKNMIDNSYLLVNYKPFYDSIRISVDIKLWKKVFVMINTDTIYRIKTEPQINEIVYIAPAKL